MYRRTVKLVLSW